MNLCLSVLAYLCCCFLLRISTMSIDPSLATCHHRSHRRVSPQVLCWLFLRFRWMILCLLGLAGTICVAKWEDGVRKSHSTDLQLLTLSLSFFVLCSFSFFFFINSHSFILINLSFTSNSSKLILIPFFFPLLSSLLSSPNLCRIITAPASTTEMEALAAERRSMARSAFFFPTLPLYVLLSLRHVSDK